MKLRHTHGIDYHQICATFESLYHRTANATERDNLIFAFIRQHARDNFDALFIAQQKNNTLASYCKDPVLREFWQTLAAEADDVENEATVNI